MKKSAAVRVVILVLLGASAQAQITSLASQDSGGIQGNNLSLGAAVSGDGRYVAFYSYATNLVPGDTNAATDVFVRDRVTATTERVSVATGGTEANSASTESALSGNGRYVAFTSFASNLVPGDTNNSTDIFVRDRLLGTTERVSVATGGAEGNQQSGSPAISADGRFVAFHSFASNLVAGDTNGTNDIFVHDRQTATTERVSVDSGSLEANGPSAWPALSADGRYVTFISYGSNLVVGDTNGVNDLFLRDRVAGTTERVSLPTGGGEADNASGISSVSADGRFVAFDSSATNLVPGDINGALDVFVRDRQTATTERVSVATGGGEANDFSIRASMSDDGRFVTFQSQATNLVAGDTNGFVDIFLRDRANGTTSRVSVGTGSIEANGPSNYAATSRAGGFVAFESDASNLVFGDANAQTDVFAYDRDPSSFTSVCSPGANGVISCPCANPPSGSGRGCDNSSGTGGAILAAQGEAYLSADSLVFSTSAERATATSILLQGTATAASGIVYGQGVRCVAGTLKRLFTKIASGGSITAPDWSVFDPTVSSRSAAKGDVILAGQSRWYLVYYRDPIVLGGCPATSTFNATQTGRVTWWP
ncbi:MAG TPA: calcium-binding protein [Planctomycetota bacterium]|jgi:hypothetical protein|nr:calcium-binding protein [Planctomycetota bacterium]